ncbi:hydoxy methyltransferase [Paenibacillus silvae]|uniref:Hydoxy methyltransferase n=1 Tax=Paenibacillus silvae TaxID=1325358 RepID=A0A2W6N8G8_9BACL|nr:hydoxy methyltransferase [Paenibacillus silvae]
MKFKKNEDNYLAKKRLTLPLCAAENRMSPFSKIPLQKDYQERYIMNGINSFSIEDNFIGSEHLYEVYKLVSEQCSKLFSAKYADARTLSGMNCVTSLLMSLTNIGDKIMLSTGSSGGHPSMEYVCKRLGLEIIDMPYNYEEFDLDYERIYDVLVEEDIKYLLYAPSDIIMVPDYNKLKLPSHTLFLYDASQTLGLIAGKQVANPLESQINCVLFGGTHKTFPGPANGLIMTNNEEIAKELDENISPKYLRNTQMHQVVSLLYTLFEMEKFGEEYAKKILEYSQGLGIALAEWGYDIPFVNKVPTQTHQLFIRTSQDTMDTIFSNAFRNNITLNKKNKRLFKNYGIRLGTQEIARLAWQEDPIEQIAIIVQSLQYSNQDIQKKIKKLEIPETLNFTFSLSSLDSLKNKRL